MEVFVRSRDYNTKKEWKILIYERESTKFKYLFFVESKTYLSLYELRYLTKISYIEFILNRNGNLEMKDRSRYNFPYFVLVRRI